jgi:uncharacterized protein YcnI
MKKYFLASLYVLACAFASTVSAHIVVKPSEAGIGSFQTFTMGVPVEKNIPTVALKLLVPAGLKEVAPTVKPGWNISMKKNGEEVTEIDWTGGSIPAGERDDFTFSAQVPSAPGTLEWKAYQTYNDGSVVAWEQDPASMQPGTEGNPFSVTKVIDDLSTGAAGSSTGGMNPAPASNASVLTLSIVALALSVVAIGIARKK